MELVNFSFLTKNINFTSVFIFQSSEAIYAKVSVLISTDAITKLHYLILCKHWNPN